MTLYFVLKYLHVLGAIVILGTGTGIAFFMLMAHRSGEPGFIARTAAVGVVADLLHPVSPRVHVRHSRLWLGYGDPLADDREAANLEKAHEPKPTTQYS